MKTSMRIISFLLATLMMLPILASTPFVAEAQESEATVTYAGTTYISSFTALKSALAEEKENWRYVLTANIDCGGATLGKVLRLGSGSVLDGDGHAILNFNTKDTNDTEGRSGVFMLSNTGTITFRNLTFGSPDAPLKISNCLVSRNPGANGDPEESIWENVNAYVDLTRENGGYLGVFYSGSYGNHRFTNCHVTVTANSSGSFIGGFFGRYAGESLIMEDCTVSGNLVLSNITENFSVGGFIGMLGDSSREGSVALTMSNCTNRATVSLMMSQANLKAGAGGFIGEMCSTGRYLNISATLSKCTNGGAIASNAHAGGFLGYSRNFDHTVRLVSCLNEGAIDGKNDASNVGGFIGYWEGIGAAYLDRCINRGAISNGNVSGGMVGYAFRGLISMDSCYNAGNIKGKNNAAHVGGLLGRSDESVSVQNSVNSGTLASAGTKLGNLGQIVSKVEGRLVLKNCQALGMVAVAATNCGAVVSTVPTDLTFENNKFVSSSMLNRYHCVDQSADALTENEAADALQAWLVGGDDGESCVAAPVIRGVQETKIENNRHSIRLLAAIDTKNYRTVGMNVQTKVNGTVIRDGDDLVCRHLYRAVTAVDDKDGSLVAHEADDPIFSGNYLMALCLTGVPTNRGDVEILATPYTVDYNGIRHDGKTLSIRYSYTQDGTKIESISFYVHEVEELFDRVFSGVLPAYHDGKVSMNTYTYSLLVGAQQANPDDYTMISVTDTSMEAFEAYIADLKTAGLSVWDAGDGTESISGYWVEMDGVRAYLYCSAKSGVARFILDKGEKQTMSPTISDSYVKKAGDNITFYMYGVDMLNDTGGTSMIAVIKLADNSLILIDGATQQQLSGVAGTHLNEFLHTITGTPAGGKITVKAWVITHHHVDHGPGLVQFFTDYHSQYDLQYMMGNMADMRDYYIDFVSSSKAYSYFPNLKLHRLHTGETIKLGGVEMDILYTLEDIVLPESGTLATSDDNDFSVQYRFRFDGIKLHMTGDISVAGEKAMLQNYEKSELKTDIFQSPHHGYNNTVKLFEAANPSVTVFSSPKSVAVTHTTVYQNLVKNTVGGEANCYFEGDETIGFEVQNGTIKVVYREKTFVG